MYLMRRFLIILFCLSLGACGVSRGTYESAGPPNPTYKVGKPYRVSGKTYRPAADPHYDRTGLASWYGSKFHGRKTANGDIFNMNDLTAAHTTLPMPSYVRVTNLDNGRWLILQINDRGPFIGDRLIDVSRRAAQLLGFEKKGVTKVRVQAVEGPRGKLPTQTQAQKTSPPRIIPTVQPEQPVVAEKKVEPPQTDMAKNIYVQIGAYSNENNAKRIVNSVHHISNTKIEKVDVNGQNLYRVRIGPHPTVELAEIILGRILSLGHNTARIITDY
ncbi:MAG: septal ring lytic transglycosylase RlpA family protein [Emcibacter sp.]|nr:septal ring lytic transglycosylase RlpA family protein [Emcibacter sp.]